MQLDPILSILIGVMVVWSAWDIVRESLNILLEGGGKVIDSSPSNGPSMASPPAAMSARSLAAAPGTSILK